MPNYYNQGRIISYILTTLSLIMLCRGETTAEKPQRELTVDFIVDPCSKNISQENQEERSSKIQNMMNQVKENYKNDNVIIKTNMSTSDHPNQYIGEHCKDNKCNYKKVLNGLMKYRKEIYNESYPSLKNSTLTLLYTKCDAKPKRDITRTKTKGKLCFDEGAAVMNIGDDAQILINNIDSIFESTLNASEELGQDIDSTCQDLAPPTDPFELEIIVFIDRCWKGKNNKTVKLKNKVTNLMNKVQRLYKKYNININFQVIKLRSDKCNKKKKISYEKAFKKFKEWRHNVRTDFRYYPAMAIYYTKREKIGEDVFDVFGEASPGIELCADTSIAIIKKNDFDHVPFMHQIAHALGATHKDAYRKKHYMHEITSYDQTKFSVKNLRNIYRTIRQKTTQRQKGGIFEGCY